MVSKVFQDFLLDAESGREVIASPNINSTVSLIENVAVVLKKHQQNLCLTEI